MERLIMSSTKRAHCRRERSGWKRALRSSMVARPARKQGMVRPDPSRLSSASTSSLSACLRAARKPLMTRSRKRAKVAERVPPMRSTYLVSVE
eukprot:scaffold32695_cov63-Phaeocystis_antarctica.AAC.2